MKDLSTSIDLNEYDVTYTDFAAWVVENNIDAYGVNAIGGNNRAKLYYFENLEDFTAFTLKFSKRPPIRPLGYRGVTSVDESHYYCPYIPLIIK